MTDTANPASDADKNSSKRSLAQEDSTNSIPPIAQQPKLLFRQDRAGIWRKLYAWVWVVTISIVGFTILGFAMLPPHRFMENISDGRPQQSIQIDRLLAALRGQVIVDSQSEIITLVPSLVEITDIYGLLPIRSISGDTPWQTYRAKEKITPGKGKVVVIISGMGLDQQATERAIDMPSAVTLEFSPYGRSLGRWALFAREKGHELLLSLPLEGSENSGIDAGNLEISIKHEIPENIHRLKTALGRMTGYIGISSGYNSPFLNEQDAMAPILRDIASRGLIIVNTDSLNNKQLARTFAQKSAQTSKNKAKSLKVPMANFDFSIDKAQTRETVEQTLQKITEKSRKNSTATIVRFSPLPVNLDAISEWLVQLENSPRHQVIPLSAIFSEKTNRQRKF